MAKGTTYNAMNGPGGSSVAVIHGPGRPPKARKIVVDGPREPIFLESSVA